MFVQWNLHFSPSRTLSHAQTQRDTDTDTYTTPSWMHKMAMDFRNTHEVKHIHIEHSLWKYERVVLISRNIVRFTWYRPQLEAKWLVQVYSFRSLTISKHLNLLRMIVAFWHRSLLSPTPIRPIHIKYKITALATAKPFTSTIHMAKPTESRKS